MCKQSVAQFRFEPGTLRRHHIPAVGDVEQLLDRDRMQGECHSHFTAVHPPLQCSQSADAADEIDALVRALIPDAQDPVQYII